MAEDPLRLPDVLQRHLVFEELCHTVTVLALHPLHQEAQLVGVSMMLPNTVAHMSYFVVHTIIQNIFNVFV